MMTQSNYPRAMRQAVPLLLFGLFVSLVSAPVSAGPMTDEQGDAILKELRQIRQALEKQAPAPIAQPPAQPPQERNGKVNVESSYALGTDGAPLTMVIFTDYQCPFCQRFEMQTFAEIKKNWIDTGKLRFVVHDQPLDFHPNAMKAAEATRCAGEQGKFWELRAKLVPNAEQLQREKLPDYAREVGLDVGKFNVCLDSGRHVEKIRAEITEASALGVNGTPSFLIGKSNGKTVEGALVVGALPYAVFEQKLNELLPK
jgi:protein-disulfide isomerase